MLARQSFVSAAVVVDYAYLTEVGIAAITVVACHYLHP